MLQQLAAKCRELGGVKGETADQFRARDPKGAAHTPGPWESPGWDGDSRVVCATVNGKRRTLAHIHGGDDTSIKAAAQWANAALIAAAPDLLAALQFAIHDLENGTCDRWKGDGSKSLRDAIAKATDAA